MSAPDDFHLAQLNIAHAIAPIDAPELADFAAALDRINALADASPGFVWRLAGDSGNATDVRTGDDPRLLVNMSVWRSAEALFEFTYRSGHIEIMRRRREWFVAPTAAYQVLWWIPAGHVPTVDEAMARLEHLRAHGPTAHAFTFKQRFAAPGDASTPDALRPEPYCVG
jgi:Domain of unknown function (DUF3291)